MDDLQWKKYPVLNDGFVCLVDSMGNDSAIVQAARVSYGKDKRNDQYYGAVLKAAQEVLSSDVTQYTYNYNKGYARYTVDGSEQEYHLYDNDPNSDVLIKKIEQRAKEIQKETKKKDRQLIRYLMSHYHTTPFEMVEFKFLVRVPMDCWRQWIRHRTASVNEYSTRYTEAIDSQQSTTPQEWRLQARNNKQGSSGFLEEWPEDYQYIQEEESNLRVSIEETGQVFDVEHMQTPPGLVLSEREHLLHIQAQQIYQERLALGVAKEQARKDLPLSTYTEAYWKINLHNLFHFLRLRMDSHAQLEIRQYANAIAEIVKQVVPVAWEAFEDYRLNAKGFSAMEMEILRGILKEDNYKLALSAHQGLDKTMTDREWKEFKEKLS